MQNKSYPASGRGRFQKLVLPFLLLCVICASEWSKMANLKSLSYQAPYLTLGLSDAVFNRTFYSLADSVLLAAPVGTLWMVLHREKNVWSQWWLGTALGLLGVELITQFLFLPLGEEIFSLNYRLETSQGVLKGIQHGVAIVSNSANAAVLVIYLGLLVWCLKRGFKDKIWRFPLIHFGAILSVAIIYHVALIGGIMKPEMSRIIQTQRTLLADVENANRYSDAQLKALFEVRRYHIYAGELERGDLPTRIGKGALARLEKSIDAAQYLPDRTVDVISRETKLHLGEVAFVGVAKVDENGSGILLLDVDHFAGWFTSMDKIISSMLLTASLLWIGFVLFLMRMHQHVIQRKKKIDSPIRTSNV
jgi:hypothetical protein